MSLPLYKIADDYQMILAMDDAETDEDTAALLALLTEVQGRFEDKAASIMAYFRGLEAETEAYRTEAKRLGEQARKRERKLDALKNYLAIEMRRAGLKEIKAGLNELKFVKNPWAVEIEPGAKIPDEYMRIPPPPEPTPDKRRMAEALKGGAQIDGVRLVQTERLKIN